MRICRCSDNFIRVEIQGLPGLKCQESEVLVSEEAAADRVEGYEVGIWKVCLFFPVFYDASHADAE